MGWLFSHSNTKEQEQARILRDCTTMAGFSFVKHATRGCNLWVLMKVDATGQHWVTLFRLKSGGPGYGYGHKAIDDAAGPYYWDCPLSFIDACEQSDKQAPSETLASWRAKVKAHHAKNKAKPKACPGMIVNYGGQAYQLLAQHANPRKGWQVYGPGGAIYRMSARQLSEALRGV